MTHPWTHKFLQCAPSIDAAAQILHVKFDLKRAQEIAMAEDWKELEAILLTLADQLKKRNSRHARSLDALVWALYTVFPYKSG